MKLREDSYHLERTDKLEEEVYIVECPVCDRAIEVNIRKEEK